MSKAGKLLKGPKGTRDVYPEDMLRRRYITQAWRDVSIRHGFEEIDGPTFETSELYAVKSGEGILGELFQAFSGKSPEEVAAVQESGRAPFAMRPEFTPTLARMYAARAKQLPKPCKWFSVGPYFRAERPQRGRLREFLQWNVDVVGEAGVSDSGSQGEAAHLDAEVLACCVGGLMWLGLSSTSCRLHVNDRRLHEAWLTANGVEQSKIVDIFNYCDRLTKMSLDDFISGARELGMPDSYLLMVAKSIPGDTSTSQRLLDESKAGMASLATFKQVSVDRMQAYKQAGLSTDWWASTMSIFRGLAYYTGTVFEVIAEGERAVAGGGRYDNLIELLGGPPTPAVGFAMGDVVLSLLLEDKNLMPEGADLLDACSRPTASLRPEAFVISADEALDAEVRRLVATLRRGKESDAWLDKDGRKPWDADRYDAASEGVRPMHARRSYKATRKIPKLLQDAAGQHAKFAVIIEDPETCTVQDLASGERETQKLADVPAFLVSRLND